MDSFHAALQSKLGIRDLCGVEFILGILLDILAKFNRSGCKYPSIPTVVGLHPQYSDTEAEPEFQRRYPSANGSLLYATSSIRPDLAFTGDYLDRCLAYPPLPTSSLCNMYLGTSRAHKCIASFVARITVRLQGSLAIDWVVDASTLRSTMGCAFKLPGGVMSWSSMIQPRVAQSPREDGYLALSHCANEAF